MTEYQIQLKSGLVEQNSTPCNFSLVYLIIRTPVSHPDWRGGGGRQSSSNFSCFLNSLKDASPPPNE